MPPKSIFDRVQAEQNTRVEKGGWPCCYRHRKDAPGCCTRRIHRRAGHAFCFLCGDWFTLRDNLAASVNGNSNCSRHVPGSRVALPISNLSLSYSALSTTSSSSSFSSSSSSALCWSWQCCNAMGREASPFGGRRELPGPDGKDKYRWGCRHGLHSAVPVALDNDQGESAEDADEDDKDKDILVRIANEETRGAHKVRGKVKPRPDRWYSVELLSNIVPGHAPHKASAEYHQFGRHLSLQSSALGASAEMTSTLQDGTPIGALTPSLLVTAITGKKQKPYRRFDPPRNLNTECLWRRLQCCVLLFDVPEGTSEHTLGIFCEAAITGKRPDVRKRERPEEDGPRSCVVDIFRVHGAGFRSDGYADSSEGEDDEDLDDVTGQKRLELLPPPKPMDGNRFQVELDSPESAERLKMRLSRGLHGFGAQDDEGDNGPLFMPLGWKSTPSLVPFAGKLVAVWVPGADASEIYRPPFDSNECMDVNEEYSEKNDHFAESSCSSEDEDGDDGEDDEFDVDERSKVGVQQTDGNQQTDGAKFEWKEEVVTVAGNKFLLPDEKENRRDDNDDEVWGPELFAFPLMVEMETTTSNDIGAQIAMLMAREAKRRVDAKALAWENKREAAKSLGLYLPPTPTPTKERSGKWRQPARKRGLLDGLSFDSDFNSDTDPDPDVSVPRRDLTEPTAWPFWHAHPPSIISAPRPLLPHFPLSGACVFCGGPWSAKDGQRCKYHPSPKYFADLPLFKPFASNKKKKVGFDAQKSNLEGTRKCRFCGVPFKKSEISHHELSCELRMVHCPHEGCGLRVTFRKLEVHSKQECVHRTIYCENEGCPHSVVAKDLANHLLVCPFRKAPCPMRLRGCRFSGTAHRLFEHIAQCPMVLGNQRRKSTKRKNSNVSSWRRRSTEPATRSRGSGVALSGKDDGAVHAERWKRSGRVVVMAGRVGKKVVAAGATIRVRCSHPGCSHVGTLSEMRVGENNHEDTCGFKIIGCEWGCGAEFPQRALAAHRHGCPERPVPCKWNALGLGCQDIVPHSTLESSALVCPFRPTVCTFCEKTFPRSRIRVHLSHECTEAQVPCRWCDAMMARSRLSAHQNEHCDRRIVACRNEGCDAMMALGDRSVHEVQCAHFQVKCQHCGKGMIRARLPHHELRKCAMIPVPCRYSKNGCQERLARGLIDQHHTHCPFADDRLERRNHK